MGGFDRFRGDTINQTEHIGFLFSQTEPKCPCAQTEPKEISLVGFGLVFFYFFIHVFFTKKNDRSIGERRWSSSNGVRERCWTSSNGVMVRVFFK